MIIAVTGGSGFIAHPLVRRLLNDGHEVRVLDLKPPAQEHKNLTFYNKSVMDEVAPVFHDCDQVYHFAAMLGVDNSDNHPLETMRVNLEGSVNVFKAAIEEGVKRIIFSSSSEVYGNPRELPIKESSVKGPVSTYGVSKLATEIYAQAFNRELGADIRIIRFFNVYGPRQSNQFVIPIFLRNALTKKPLRIFGDGSQTRCFTFVEDAVDGLLTVVDKGKPAEAYNVGNNQPTTLLGLAETIQEVVGSHVQIEKVPFGKDTRLREREIDYRIPDISKVNSLGWEPTTRIREGVEKMAAWMRES